MSPWLVLGIAWVVCAAIFLECAYRAPIMEIWMAGWRSRRPKPAAAFLRGLSISDDYRYRRRGHSRVRPTVPVREAARQLEPAE